MSFCTGFWPQDIAKNNQRARRSQAHDKHIRNTQSILRVTLGASADSFERLGTTTPKEGWTNIEAWCHDVQCNKCYIKTSGCGGWWFRYKRGSLRYNILSFEWSVHCNFQVVFSLRSVRFSVWLQCTSWPHYRVMLKTFLKKKRVYLNDWVLNCLCSTSNLSRSALAFLVLLSLRVTCHICVRIA